MDDLPHWNQFVREMIKKRGEKEIMYEKKEDASKAGEKLSNYKRSDRI